jgi:Domain of unknown function (DUF1893)
MNNQDEKSPSLQVFRGDERIFTHTGKWLHPLFALESFLADAGIPPGELRLRDRIIGKAAALLILRMGIRRVYGELMSDLGADYLVSRGAEIGWGTRVPLIACRTEELLETMEDPEAAYAELRRRAGLE